MQNHDDKYPSRSRFEPGTSRLQAAVDTNVPGGGGGLDIVALISNRRICQFTNGQIRLLFGAGS